MLSKWLKKLLVRFFFYGTLVAGSGNPVARAIHARLRPLGPATVRGSLHALPELLGWYPALLPGAGVVRGMLYEAGTDFGADDLARIDAYEDHDPQRSRESLYLRREVAAMDVAGAVSTAQAYLFNAALPAGAMALPGGDFAAWLAQTGHLGYAGA